jgi:hypothetical protein
MGLGQVPEILLESVSRPVRMTFRQNERDLGETNLCYGKIGAQKFSTVHAGPRTVW